MRPSGLAGHEVRQKIISKELSAREVVEDLFARIDEKEPLVNAYLELDREAALGQADAVDGKVAAGEPLGKLAGVPVAVKDNMCAVGMKATCASKILASFRPPYDAHVVERLRAEDAVIVGKTNLDEFAMGSSTENSGVKTTRNPWNLDRIPGGSSGGSQMKFFDRLTTLLQRRTEYSA